MPSVPTAPDRIFPLTLGSSERPHLRAPRLAVPVAPVGPTVMGNRAFMRAWAARRAKLAAAGRAS